MGKAGNFPLYLAACMGAPLEIVRLLAPEVRPGAAGGVGGVGAHPLR